MAVAAYLVRTTAGQPDARAFALTDDQERRLKALMDANLDGRISMSALAEACGLPPSALAGAFRRKAGVLPHRWMLQRRIDLALDLLRRRSLPPVEVAAHCGFAGARQFLRVLRRLV